MDILIIAIIGLSLGSFATVLFYRIPRGQPWGLKGHGAMRSRCPSCQHVLEIRDLIPVFSWVVSRGRCRHCGAAVSAFYPLVEITVMLLTIAVYLVFRAFSG